MTETEWFRSRSSPRFHSAINSRHMAKECQPQWLFSRFYVCTHSDVYDLLCLIIDLLLLVMLLANH